MEFSFFVTQKKFTGQQYLYLYFADDSGYDADFFNITFKDENTFVLEEEYRDGSEYEYEKAVFKRM